MIRFSGVSNRNFLGKLVRIPLAMVPKTAVIPILQGPAKGLKWIAGSGIHGMWLGSYESEKQKFLAKLNLEGTTVLDIGTHVGFYSILLSRLVGKNGKVVSFEPLPRNLEFLKQHIQLNELRNIQIHSVALGAQEGALKFDASNDPFEGRLSETGNLEVMVKTLDSLGKISPQVSLIKMDVEGAEAQVLKGGKVFFERYRPLILLATHGTEEVSDCKAILHDYEYKLKPLGKDLYGQDCDEWIATPQNRTP